MFMCLLECTIIHVVDKISLLERWPATGDLTAEFAALAYGVGGEGVAQPSPAFFVHRRLDAGGQLRRSRDEMAGLLGLPDGRQCVFRLGGQPGDDRGRRADGEIGDNRVRGQRCRPQFIRGRVSTMRAARSWYSCCGIRMVRSWICS